MSVIEWWRLRTVPSRLLAVALALCCVAAALAVEQGVDVKQVSAREIQKKLREQNVLIPE